jgi:3-phenylpropionate/trans-cinnamate dioxygenase ferredoxin reductase component
MNGVVIVGAGPAGTRCAERLRAGGYDRPVTVIGDEPVPPYRRPALSKELLAGTAGLGDLRLRPTGWWEASDIELVLGSRVERIDPARRRVILAGSGEVSWAELVIATGSRARRLPGLPPLRGIHTLRSLQDSLRLRSDVRAGRRIVIVGAGFVGTEVASTALSIGAEVTVIDPAPPLSRVLGDEVSALLAARYREHGVDLRTAAVGEIEGTDGRVSAVRLGDGERIACDALLVAVGAQPAVPHGIPEAPEGGIAADARGRTGLDGVFAAGDVARAAHPLLGRDLRVEHWADAAAQGVAVADAILGVDPTPRELPLFWSDQFGLRLQYVGHATAWSAVELDGGPDEFCVRYLDHEGGVLAALAANRPRELGRLRRELSDALPQAA